MSYSNLATSVNATLDAHGKYPAKPGKAFRKWDGTTPYAIHPIWCAMTVLAETALPEEQRLLGYQTLLFHDILEDTTYVLQTSPEVRALVEAMTFDSSDHEMVEVWNRSEEVRLFKLYDKVSNLLDATWMDSSKWNRYCEYTLRLAADVEKRWSGLNIVTIARAIAQPRSEKA